MKRECEKQLSVGERAASYWFVDGLPHIVFGLALVTIGVLGLLWGIYLPNRRAGHWVTVGFGFLAYGFAAQNILHFLKSRLTYPRTGYVQPPEETERESMITISLRPSPPRRRNVTSFERRIVMVVLFFLVTPFLAWQRWFIPVLMAALAAALYFLNRNSEPSFRWWSALILGIMGLVFLWVDVPPVIKPSLPLLLVGLWLAALGVGRLIRYLRENPYPKSSGGVRP